MPSSSWTSSASSTSWRSASRSISKPRVERPAETGGREQREGPVAARGALDPVGHDAGRVAQGVDVARQAREHDALPEQRRQRQRRMRYGRPAAARGLGAQDAIGGDEHVRAGRAGGSGRLEVREQRDLAGQREDVSERHQRVVVEARRPARAGPARASARPPRAGPPSPAAGRCRGSRRHRRARPRMARAPGGPGRRRSSRGWSSVPSRGTLPAARTPRSAIWRDRADGGATAVRSGG